jgi:alpha-galactosidase
MSKVKTMNRTLLSALLAVLACTPLYGAVSVSPEEMGEASQWVAVKFKGVVASEAPEAGLMVLANNDPVQLNTRGGRPMRIADKQYSRGLYCHAVSKVVVRLPGPGKSFSAIAGVDSNEQTSGGRGSVVFSVNVGGKERFRSQVVREGMGGVTVNVPLEGVREFALEIGDAGDGISCDQSDWADAKVVLADGRELWLGDLPILGKAREPYSTQPPFSFTYGGRASSEFLSQWKLEREPKKLDDQRDQHTMSWSDPQSGLCVRCVGVQYHDYPTVEWTVYFKNTSTADSPII